MPDAISGASTFPRSISEEGISRSMAGPFITHMVLFKYRKDIPWSELESHFADFKALQSSCLHPATKKPCMLSMRMGKKNSWEPWNKGMTHGFVLEFESQEHLDYYLLEDPVHLDFSRKAKPLIEDSVVGDIKDGILFGPSPKKPKGSGGKHRGSCHCGGLEWWVTVEEDPSHILCHCDTCKKLGGGSYSCNMIVPVGSLEIFKGQPKSYVYKGASGKLFHFLDLYAYKHVLLHLYTTWNSC
jgi:hypothetical protein